jgi:hypothetical protein
LGLAGHGEGGFRAAAGILAVLQILMVDSGATVLSDQAVLRIRPRIRTGTAGQSLPVRWVVAEPIGRHPRDRT